MNIHYETIPTPAFASALALLPHAPSTLRFGRRKTDVPRTSCAPGATQVFFSWLPGRNTGVHITSVILSLTFGVGIIYTLNYLIDLKTNPELLHLDANHPKTADDLDELIHSDHYKHHYNKKDSKAALFIAGVVMASAIALHNVPEGMTIGAAYASNNGQMGSAAIMLAILIGLHNIPEGMAVAVPLIAGGTSKWKAVLITASSGWLH